MNPEENKLAAAAWHSAARRLRDRYVDEYEELHRQERVARGLSPEPISNQNTLKREVERLRQRIKDLEA